MSNTKKEELIKVINGFPDGEVCVDEIGELMNAICGYLFEKGKEVGGVIVCVEGMDSGGERGCIRIVSGSVSALMQSNQLIALDIKLEAAKQI